MLPVYAIDPDDLRPVSQQSLRFVASDGKYTIELCPRDLLAMSRPGVVRSHGTREWSRSENLS